MLCISASSWTPRILVPPWPFETCSSSGCNEVGESTSLWWSMRWVSCFNSCCSMSTSNCSTTCSISWAKSCPYDGSPCSPNARCLDELTTCTGTVSSICTWCTSYCMCLCCASFSSWRSSCSFRSCSLNSCNSFSASSILFLSLCLHVIRLSYCCLFAWIAIASCSTSGYTWNLQLFSSSMRSTIFLFPLSRICMLGSAAFVAATTTTIVDALREAALLTTQQWSWTIHWARRNCRNTSMSLPRPNEMPHGSSWIEISCSDPSQCNVGHTGWSFKVRTGISPSLLLRHLLSWYSRSRITQSVMEEWAKVSSSSTIV